jgi:hypothetical protein
LGAAAIFAVVLGCLFTAALIGGIDGERTPVAAQQTQTAQANKVALGTGEPEISLTPTNTGEPVLTATETLVPTTAPSPTIIPTATIPVGIPFSRINGISLDNQGYYSVAYETFEFTESLPGMHVHFFFNTVPQEQAGVPGQGPWILYGGPRPFGEYHKEDRPEDATHMCILVANADHSVQPKTGNCFQLPDVSLVTAKEDLVCRTGPSQDYSENFLLPAHGVVPVLGISPDEMWWQVADPVDEGETCWLERERTLFNGDITTLPLAEPPPPPDIKTVSITGISINAQSRYVVEYTTQGFTEELPGTHLHFFFNTVSPEENRLMHGGPSPFTRYTTGDRPPESTQMCVLVANPDHSLNQDSGNCFDLPDA